MKFIKLTKHYSGQAAEGSVRLPQHLEWIHMDFYSELLKSNVFCESLGRLILTSGKLESSLKSLLENRRTKEKLERLPLGALIKICEQL